MSNRYDEDGRRVFLAYSPKTRLQLATAARDVALQNLVSAAEVLGERQKDVSDAITAESPCLCHPNRCTKCGR